MAEQSYHLQENQVQSGSRKAQQARELFQAGANCAQAVFGAFHQECGMSLDEALKLASGFGGGFSRMREVCGAVSGMVLVINRLHGNSDLSHKEAKDSNYALIQKLMREFSSQTGSYICRELLKAESHDHSPYSTERTPEFYRKRPCGDLVALATEIVERTLAELQ